MSNMQWQQKSLSHGLRSFLMSGLDAAVLMVAADGQVAADGSVLAARSSVFAAILSQEQRVVAIPDMPLDVVQELLTFMYTDQVPRLQSMAPQLLALADRFKLPVLKALCEQQMIKDLSVENTVSYCVLAKRYSCQNLMGAGIDYFSTYALQVLGSKGWVQELRNDPKPLVEISRLVATRAMTEASVEELRKLLDSGIRIEEEKMSI